MTIAANFIRHPAALLAQRELELVIAAPETLTREASDRIDASLRANVAWALEFVRERVSRKIPGWLAEMKRKAAALARTVRAACLNLF